MMTHFNQVWFLCDKLLSLASVCNLPFKKKKKKFFLTKTCHFQSVENGSVQTVISAPHNKCPALKCTNRSMWFGTQPCLEVDGLQSESFVFFSPYLVGMLQRLFGLSLRRKGEIQIKTHKFEPVNKPKGKETKVAPNAWRFYVIKGFSPASTSCTRGSAEKASHVGWIKRKKRK